MIDMITHVCLALIVVSSQLMHHACRWYDAHPELKPLWHFGHGLSYTTFTYSNIAVSGTIKADGTSSATVTFTVTNAGA